jgi:hypothetical protein
MWASVRECHPNEAGRRSRFRGPWGAGMTMLDERRRKDVRNEIVWTATAVVGLALALILPPRLAIALGLLLAVVSFVALGFSLSNSEACDINASCPTSERVAEWIDEGLFFPAPILVLVGLGRLVLQRRARPGGWRRAVEGR